MNFLFISTNEIWGGSESFWCDVAERLLREGHSVTVVLPVAAPVHARHEELRQLGATFIRRPGRQKPTPVNKLTWKLRGLDAPETDWWRNNFRESFDTVFLSQGGTYCVLSLPGLLPWLLEQAVPYSIICHSHRSYALPDAAYRADLQKFFREAAHIFFVAEENKRAASRYLAADLPNASVVQTPLTADIPGLVPWPTGNTLRMACIGRFELRDKGQDLLIEALASPKWKDRDFELTLFGTGPDKAIIQELVRHHGLQAKVRFGDFIPDVRQTWKRWETHHLLVLPSLSEGTPIVLIEAQLCGRPALVTRVDGNAEWVEDGETGFVAEAATVYHLSEGLERVWSAREYLRSYGEASRSRCEVRREKDPVDNLVSALFGPKGNAQNGRAQRSQQ